MTNRRGKPLNFNKLTYDQAMAVARRYGKAVRCDAYMSPGWKIMYIKSGRGMFNINPHTGSNYHFTPQAVDFNNTWKVVP